MKITFDDKSYIECKQDNDKVIIIISAKDHFNLNKKIVNAVEISVEQFQQLVSEIQS